MREVSEESRKREPKVNLTEYWRILWRKKYFVLIPTILAGSIAVVGVRFIAPVYRSSSLIAIEDQSYLSRQVEQFVNVSKSARRRLEDEDTLAKLHAEIRSTAFLNQLIERLGIARDPNLIAAARADQATTYPDLSVEELVFQRLRGRLKNKFQVSHTGPAMFRITAFDYDPDACYVLADVATSAFADYQRTKQLRGLEGAGEFGEEQLAVYKQRLQESELELERLKKRVARWRTEDNPVTARSLSYAETHKQQLILRIKDIEDIIARLRARIHSLVGSLPKNQDIWDDPELEDIWDGLIANRETVLRLELEGRSVTTQDWEESTEGILQDEEALQRRLSVLVDVHHPEISVDSRPLVVEYLYQIAQLESYRAQLSKLGFHVTTFERKLGELPEMEMELSRLEEQVRTDRELYNSFLRAKTSTQISQAIQQTDLGGTIEIMEKAKRPRSPYKPDKAAIVILALVFGAGVGVGGLVFSEYADTSFGNVEEIEELLGLRVLGTIPHFESGAKWNQMRVRRLALIWSGVSVVVVAVALFGFYYYGKVAAKQAINVYLAPSAQQVDN
jgi:uncharacterized protein involved in exopolysaccharide biosynthesis